MGLIGLKGKLDFVLGEKSKVKSKSKDQNQILDMKPMILYEEGEQVVQEQKVQKKKPASKAGQNAQNELDDSLSEDGEQNGLDVYDGEGESDDEMPDEFYDEELGSEEAGDMDDEDDYIEMS